MRAAGSSIEPAGCVSKSTEPALWEGSERLASTPMCAAVNFLTQNRWADPQMDEHRAKVAEACERFAGYARRLTARLGPVDGASVLIHAGATELLATLGPEQAGAYLEELAALVKCSQLPVVH